MDTACSLEDLLEVIDYRDGGKEELGKSMLTAQHYDDDDDDCSSTKMALVLENPQRLICH